LNLQAANKNDGRFVRDMTLVSVADIELAIALDSVRVSEVGVRCEVSSDAQATLKFRDKGIDAASSSAHTRSPLAIQYGGIDDCRIGPESLKRLLLSG
jgi:hypothetical protein